MAGIFTVAPNGTTLTRGARDGIFAAAWASAMTPGVFDDDPGTPEMFSSPFAGFFRILPLGLSVPTRIRILFVTVFQILGFQLLSLDPWRHLGSLPFGGLPSSGQKDRTRVERR